MAHSDLFAYFGFGSLVNRKTLASDVVATIPARLKGWRRHWQSRPKEPFVDPARQSIALLNIHQNEDCAIDGLIIVDRRSNLAALDERERSYQKVHLSTSDLSYQTDSAGEFSGIPVHVYVSPGSGPDQAPLRILRSYLDVVFQGFSDVYGENGIADFLSTTDGFHLPIDEDRKQPKYPRHQPLSDDERRIFDEVLVNQGWHN